MSSFLSERIMLIATFQLDEQVASVRKLLKINYFLILYLDTDIPVSVLLDFTFFI